MSCPQDFTSGVLHTSNTTLGTFYVGRSTWSRPQAREPETSSAAPDGGDDECKDDDGDEEEGGDQGGEDGMDK